MSTDSDTTVESEPVTGTENDAYGPDDGLLVLRNVTKRFGGLTAVDDLSFAVRRARSSGSSDRTARASRPRSTA